MGGLIQAASGRSRIFGAVVVLNRSGFVARAAARVVSRRSVVAAARIAINCRAIPGSPAPWNVSATSGRPRGPFAYSTAGPLDTGRGGGDDLALVDGGGRACAVPDDGVPDLLSAVLPSTGTDRADLLRPATRVPIAAIPSTSIARREPVTLPMIARAGRGLARGYVRDQGTTNDRR
jgi:hypothetical protein